MMSSNTKRGVSLITVLLFMLVATIAATATYKWLTSESRSSAARLQKNEAYQNSQAGLESARSWMTYHASDVGSLIKQYKSGGNQPILLNSRLKELTRANQNHDVWLVGANTEKSTYKLKILSSGKGPSGAVYNQVGIFNVDGLYQVTLSKKKQITATDFDYAYFGGSYTGAGNVTISSAIVNGNWAGNPQNVTKSFVVTGNADLSGNNVNIGKLGCIGGDVNIGNQGLYVEDLYVGGNAFGRITTQGDAYFEHNVMQASTGAIDIAGSMTLNGIMQTNQATGEYSVYVGKNLCADDAARIRLGGTGGSFVVGGSVWMPNIHNVAYGSTADCLCEEIYETFYPAAKTVVAKVPCSQYEFPSSNQGRYYLGQIVSCSDKINTVGSDQYSKLVLGSNSEAKVFVKGAKGMTGVGGYSEIRKEYTEKPTDIRTCSEEIRFIMRKEGIRQANGSYDYNWVNSAYGSYKYNPVKSGTPLDDAKLAYVCGAMVQESYVSMGECKKYVCDAYNYGGFGGMWGGFGGMAGCAKGHWETYPCATGSTAVVDFAEAWGYWGAEGGNYVYTAFPEVTAQDDMYFLFDGGKEFLKYEKDPTHENQWGHFVAVAGGSQDGSAIPIHVSDAVNFDKHFNFKTDIFAYRFELGAANGGKKPYYDMTTGEYNYYNYADGKATGSPYCYNDGSESGAFRPTCGVTPWFKSNGTVKGNTGAKESADKPSCAEDVKTRCESYWGTEQTTGCDESKYKVPNVLETGYDSFIGFAEKGCAANIKSWSQSLGSELNKCYRENVADETKKSENLYNGYLVVSITGASGTNNCPTGNFEGNYIIVVDGNPIDCQNGLPPVTDGYRTFLFLKKGADNIGGATTKNYFIYTQDQIKSAKQLNLIGSIYADAEYCAGMGDMQSSTLTYDPELTSDMVDAGILCEKSKMEEGATCGGVKKAGETSGGSGSGSASATIVKDESDSYYVSNAPTLSIKLESQYRSDEPLPSKDGAIEVEGDFIVVPRVIYLTKDPYGKLSDYYNVIGLNGLTLNKESGSVSCDAGLPTTTELYDRSSASSAKLAKEEYKCSYTYNGISVPFYVKVSGESGSTPYVRFTESAVELASTTTYEVKISVPAHSAALTIGITKPGDIEGWTITDNLGSCDGNKCEFTVPANANRSEITVFNVSTQSAGTGTAMFQLASGEGYLIGTPGTIVLGISSNAYVNRSEATVDELTAFCETNSGCPSSLSTWPNCSSTDPWVKAAGCKTLTQNNSWSCPLSEDVSYEKTGDVSGCIPIITTNILDKNNLNAGGVYTLSASLKARPMSLKLGFKGANLSGRSIVATVVNSVSASRVGSRKSCTYGYDVQSTDATCSMDVFNGEVVRVGFEDGRPESFNYWSCSGNSCPMETHSGDTYSGITIVESGNTVYAHFGESDKHCFFDEFKTGIDCSEPYCLLASSKWNVVGDASRIDYKDGYVAAKPSKTDKNGIIVLSKMAPGSQGTLKAQFQVPQIPYGAKSKASALVKNSGFIFNASDLNATDYLQLSLYEDNSGYLTALLCKSDGSTCKESQFSAGYSKLVVTTLTVVTLSAEVSSSGLDLTARVGRLGASSSYTVSFNYETDLSGYTPAGSLVGFRLADPSFKLFDIGWKSSTYGAQCWDTYPTVNCSFKSAYAGGVVPLDSNVVPWVGLSSWFDSKNCLPSYYYKGDDACSRSSSAYEQCTSDYYNFTARGTHGTTDANGQDIRTAKAGVGNCYNLTDEKDRMLAESEWGHCGEFWVGKLNFCKVDQYFLQTSETVYDMTPFNLPSGESANLREATLKVNLENNDASNVEIYLLSQDDGGQVHHSKHFETNSTGLITINVESLLDVADFDPEHVYGVVVNILNDGTNVTVKEIYSACPNVVTLNCVNAISYDATSGKWTVSANMTNFTNAKSFKVTEVSSNVSSVEFDCTADPSECSASENKNGKSATFSFDIKDNPYRYNAGKDYQFRVDMTTLDEKSFTCTTGSMNVPAISAVCGTLSTNSVKSGDGLPKFTYSMSNCPSTGCPYKISLEGMSTPIATGQQDVSNGQTGSSAGNNSSKGLLEPRNYRFHLESADTDVPFEDCYSDYFTVRSLASDVDVECGVSKSNNTFDNVTTFYTTDGLYFVARNKKDGNDQIASIQVYKGDDPTNNSLTIAANDKDWHAALNIGTLAEGSYNYRLVLANNVEICNANITVKNVADDVSATCADVTVYPKLHTGNLITMSGIDKVENDTPRQIKIGEDPNPKASDDCRKDKCPDLGIYAPQDVGTYNYDMYFGGKYKCSGTITVNSALSCSANKTSLKLGESFDFSATYGGSCENSTFTGDGVTNNSCTINYTVKPTAIGNEKEYKIFVDGSAGSAYCTVKVSVSEDKPVVTCPDAIAVEPGAEAKFSLKALNNCSACTYTLGNASIPKNGDGSFTFETDGITTRYNFVAENSAGSDNCNVEVEYTEKTKETAVCTISSNDIYVGEKISFKATSIEPTNQNVKLELLVDNSREYYSDSYWTPNGFSREQDLEKISFTSAGSHTIVLKVNDKVACSRTVTVSTLPDNVVSTEWKTYYPGNTYSLQVRQISGSRSFKCRVSQSDVVSYERTVAVVKGKDLKTPAYNSYSNGSDDLEDFAEFTLIVKSDSPDLECALSY